MKEYSLATGFKIFIYFVSVLIVGAGTWGLIQAFFFEKDPGEMMSLAGLALLFLLFGVWMFLEARVGKVIQGDNFIRSETLFTKRELLLSQIGGYNQVGYYINIWPNRKGLKKISISIYYGSTSELLMWLQHPQSDAPTREADEILSKGEQQRLLKKAGWNAKIINVVGFVPVAGLFFGSISLYTSLLAIVLPWVAISVMYYYKGLITINSHKGSRLPSTALAILMPSLILALTALRSIHLLNTAPIWLPVVTLILLMGTFLYATAQRGAVTSNRSSIWGGIIMYALVLPAYGYGTTVLLNAKLDSTSPAYLETRVTSKRISKGDGDAYYLKLEPWGPLNNTGEEPVDRDLYLRTAVGGKVGIYVKKGWMNIPWYIITDPQQ